MICDKKVKGKVDERVVWFGDIFTKRRVRPGSGKAEDVEVLLRSDKK